MPYEITRKLRDIDPYEPMEREYKIHLDANESFIDIFKESPQLAERISEEIKKMSLNRYPDTNARELTLAFADYYNIPAKYLTPGNGSDEIISFVIGSLLNKGDNMVVLSPDFSMYAFYGSLYEQNMYHMPKEENLAVNIPKIIDYCNNNDVKAVIFSNPCNPTSLGVKRDDIIKLAKNLFCLVIVDEAYMDFWDESVLDEVENYDNLIVLKTCSKAFGMAGLRVGFAAAGETVTNALRCIKPPYNISCADQIIAKNILMEKRLLKECTERVIASRKALSKELTEFAEDSDLIDKVYDSAANFVFVKTKFAEKITGGLQEASISVKKVGANHIRVTAGTEEENAAFMTALKKIELALS